MYANIKPTALLRRQAKRQARQAEEQSPRPKRARTDTLQDPSSQVFHTVTTHNTFKKTTLVLDSEEAPYPPTIVTTESLPLNDSAGQGASKSKVNYGYHLTIFSLTLVLAI